VQTDPIHEKLRIGVIGCGDVAYRRYFPALATLADRVEIVGCCSASAASAERAAAHVRTWSANATAYTDVGRMLA
jgi:predicted dehydrogenase